MEFNFAIEKIICFICINKAYFICLNNEFTMRTKTKKNFVVTKKNHVYTISEKKSGKSLYHIMDVSVYDNFDLEKPVLSGLGSVMNVPGNYYSFEKYLSNNNDSQAIISDWRKVGSYFLEALSLYKE